MKRFFAYVIIYLFLFTGLAGAQDDNYYATLNPNLVTFITDLESRIRSPYTQISYAAYISTNIDNFASFDNGNGTRSVYCVYSSYNYVYDPPFTWLPLSREHTWCFSWQPTNPSQSAQPYTDQYHLFPTEQNNVNSVRSNHPLGIVTTIISTFGDAKYGRDASNYLVYEPRDIHKGDAARALLYMSVRYDGVNSLTWNFNWLNSKLSTLGEGPQNLSTLFAWHLQDPPDKWEVSRNNYIQSIQQNRNPFVDHPEYVHYINFNDLTKLTPSFSTKPDNYASNFDASVNGTSITLTWTDAIAGNQAPSGYLLEAYNYDNYYIPVDGSVYSNDEVLSDGMACVNIDYSAANIYTFTDLTTSQTYYFRLYSYNGDGTLRNYKINVTVPAANIAIPGVLAVEPENYLTNLSAGDLTSSSIALTWTDAIPGSQVPSGYLILANNNNVFTAPSDGNTYADDLTLSDGSAVANVDYSASNNFSFSSLPAETTYYFKIYSYNGTGYSRNYKTDGTVPSVTAATLQSGSQSNIVLLDNFNRVDNNIIGTTSLGTNPLTWGETETVSNTGVRIVSNRIQLGSGTAGRDFAFVNLSTVSGYPSVLNGASVNMQWAFNIRQTRTDPSGFNSSNYGVAFILGMTSSDYATANGYAVVLGQSGSTDPVRLVHFSGGIDLNSNLTDIISGGDYGSEYISIKVTYEPSTNTWSLFAESSSSDFPQSDPRNVTTQISTSTVNNSLTGSTLSYLGCLWNHSTTSSENAVFDDIYISDPGGALPVVLFSFTTNVISRDVKLKWTTASEQNNSGFEILRSNQNDKNNWTKVAFITGNGTKSTPTNYSFWDRNLQTGKYYYRLKQIDFNGNYQYYYLRNEVTIGVPKKFELSQNFPNPFNPVTKINYELPNDSKVSIKIFDMLGREVRILMNEFKTAGYHSIDFDGSTLSSGMYFYRIKTNEFEAIKKMLLIK